MFCRLIEKKRDEWLASDGCTVRGLLAYIEQKGMMRDAQIQAIKTYLFLKIVCQNKPLWQLFAAGRLSTLDIDGEQLERRTWEALRGKPAAIALLEYTKQADRNGHQLSPKAEQYIKGHIDDIDFEKMLYKVFYETDYSSSVYSLPMGAGKTFLMAAFIYLDLYFSKAEEHNKAFARNFMVLVPSGLKSSILPSLKSIKRFDPSWVIPEPAASQLRAELKFEILDEPRTEKKSNLVRDPNAQTISTYQPLQQLRGLVAIVNAEKVILHHADKAKDRSLYSPEEWQRICIANELRHIIGRIPQLSLFIDEVHHTVKEDNKLRHVVNEWTRGGNIVGVTGFSGTPYLKTASEVELGRDCCLKSKDMANVVCHYPLIDGIDNFLKKPIIHQLDAERNVIIDRGVRAFLDQYADKRYKSGALAKLAIYCGRIDTLENEVLPLVASIVAEYGMNVEECVLKYYGDTKEYRLPKSNKTAFEGLDNPLSPYRIVLLVQIGKEGWDCRSLTGVILPQNGLSSNVNILQTSCRCLRQVDRGVHETAMIWLNKENATILDNELSRAQNTSIEEINHKADKRICIERFSRMPVVKLPPIDYWQMRMERKIDTVKPANPAEALWHIDLPKVDEVNIVKKVMLGDYLDSTETTLSSHIDEMPMTFHAWVHLIAKESFQTIAYERLMKHEKALRHIFGQISYEKEGTRRLSRNYRQDEVRANVRKTFRDTRATKVDYYDVKEQAEILIVERLQKEQMVTDDSLYYPNQATVKKILEDDRHPDKVLKDDIKAAIGLLKGNDAVIRTLTDDPASYIDPKDNPNLKTYHTIPYHFDSTLERNYFAELLLGIIKEYDVEVYYNGEPNLTQFSIQCYRPDGNDWVHVRKYTPDFLILRRNAENQIERLLILETKGQVYANDFRQQKEFVENWFLKKNAGRFQFHYIEGKTKVEAQEVVRLQQKIKDFFQI